MGRLKNKHSKFKEKENKSINLNDILTLSQPYHDLKAKIPSTTCNGYITFNLFFRGGGGEGSPYKLVLLR